MPLTEEQALELLTKGDEMGNRHIQEVKDQVPSERFRALYSIVMTVFLDFDDPTRKLLIKHMSETQAHIDDCDFLSNPNAS